jgi:hypothetical protein
MTQKTDEIILSSEDYQRFRAWLDLNLDAVTWQGRYRQEFEDFWSLFFIDGLSVSQLAQRFEYAKRVSKIGPLTSWFTWLRDKLVCYVFLKKSVTVLELATQFQLPVTQAAAILRNFFIENFPYLDDELSELFQIGHAASAAARLCFPDLKNTLSIEAPLIGSHDDEIMTSMEVTLYDEWVYFVRKMRKEIYGPQFDIEKIKRKASFSKQLKVMRDIILLLLIGGGIILIVQRANVWYEDYLLDKISVYEPQFEWLDNELTFQEVENVNPGDFNLDIDDIEEVENVAADFNVVTEEERFDTESEVTLTSWDSLPRDFSVANLEVSSYEELESRGYRDSRYGHTKVYRVLMKSVDTYVAKSKLDVLLKNYEVSQVDNVKPGQDVPGGIYYNLFVPRERLKEFIAQVMEVDDSILYESRTRAGRNPVGKNKVFIWVKNI